MEIWVYNASTELKSYVVSAVEFAMAKFFDAKDLDKYISVDVDPF